MSQSGPSALATVRDYHGRTKHRFEAYAHGPEALDWDAQPAPFRYYEGAPRLALPRLGGSVLDGPLAVALQRPWPTPGALDAAAQPFTLENVAALLQLSLGITAWKRYGPDRWAVRANPSSGNLHPAEAYLLIRGLAGVADGVWHYRPDDHALELRAAWPAAPVAVPSLGVVLSSVMWREAWKYGERAFRYCQLDTGHAAACLRVAAGLLGWTLQSQPQLGHAAVARVAGTDRADEFPYRRWMESTREEAEVLLAAGLDGRPPVPVDAGDLEALAAEARWYGTATLIDPHPLYRWPVIEAVAVATRREDGTAPAPAPLSAAPIALGGETVAGDGGPPRPSALRVIQGRRSAQRFDHHHVMAGPDFIRLLSALTPSDAMPWDVLPEASTLQLLLFVHRVTGFEPGLYVLERDPAEAGALLELAKTRWTPGLVAGLPEGLRLTRLTEVGAPELQRAARSIHCHQDIAATSCFSLGMVARFGPRVEADPACYRDLLRAAGVLGQVLYLEAEAIGLRGTGIGCFFDDPVHALLGLDDDGFQTLYHFTVGQAIEDTRIEIGPAYPG